MTESQNSSRPKNVFILGYDEDHGADVRRIPDADRFRFHPLLRSEELVYQKNYDVMQKIDDARKVLRDFDGPVDGIICHWDFPVTIILAVLCREFDLPAPSLEAVITCSHKYWSRIKQREVAPENTPDFCAVDPFDDQALEKLALDYPFWIKPIKGYASTLGFKVENAEDFRHAISEARDKIGRIGNAFNRVLKEIDLPPEVEGIDGNYLIAEQLVSGTEIAPEGYMQHGQFHSHGVFNMVQADNGKSFLRVEYPSTAPERVQKQAKEVAEKVIKNIGFDNGCFNMEFFWDQEKDKLWIIEVNERISQSHSYQFEMVDGMSNHEIAIHVALGDKPLFEHGSGPYTHAGKHWLRRYDTRDAIVRRLPGEEDFRRLQEEQPDTQVSLTVKEGQKLSELMDQDAYSYVLAEVKIAANSVEELDRKYDRAKELLPFDFEIL